jgi:hypothetical protein
MMRDSGVAPCRSLRAMNDLRASVTAGLGRVGLETAAATGLICAACANHDEFVALHQALCVNGRIPAANADGQQFSDFFSDGQKTRHGFERPATIVGIETSDNDALTEVGELGAHVHHFFAQELCFVDADNFGAWLQFVHDFSGLGDVVRWDAESGVGNDFVCGKTGVDGGLEDLHALAGESGTPQPADEFFAFAGEHRANDNFDPTHVALHNIHALSPVLPLFASWLFIETKSYSGAKARAKTRKIRWR